jgi:peptide/nickel transport system substrate-binding protein
MAPRVRLVVLAVACAAAAICLSSALGFGSRASQTIPVLRVGITPAPPTLDQAKNNAAVFVTSMFMEQLMQVGPGGKQVPWLAQSVTQPGKGVYVYHLRHGVKFWDGRELTATDVANALNYNRYPGSIVAYAFPTVKTVTAVNKYTVAVTLRRVDSSFKWLVSQPPTEIFEKAFQDAHKSTFGQPGTLTMGTGPWRVASFDPTQGMELVANDNYWQGKPQIRRISVKFFSDETSMALAFRAGEIDVAPFILGPQAFAATAHTKLLTSPSCATALLWFNTKTPPMDDVHVRRAVAYAINRADLIKVNGGFSTPNSTLIPRIQLLNLAPAAQVDKLLNSLPQYPYNPAKARAELALAKYKNPEITFEETQYGNFLTITQAIANELAKVGIRAKVTNVPLGQWYGDLLGPADKRPAAYSASGCNSPDPSFNMLYLGTKNLRTGSFNVANYAPPELDTLIDQGTSTADPAKRLVIYGKILRKLALDVPIISLWAQDYPAALSSRFTWPTYSKNSAPLYSRVWPLEIKPR